MLKYKIVATDLDGTLLDHDCRVSAENFAAIHALVEKGVHCAIATGRTLNEIPKEILACEDLRYIIYSNGAMVLDKAEDRRISACIDRKNILRMMDIFADYKVHISVRYDGTCYTDATLPLVENAEFYRYGVMHRNTYLNSPHLLASDYSMRVRPSLFFAGQMTGVEGYVESTGSGLVAGLSAAARALGVEIPAFPAETMLGAMAGYISDESVVNFQPMNANFGIIPMLGRKVKGGKSARNEAYAARALEAIDAIATQISHLRKG